MESNKVTPHEDYDYSAKVPDFLTVNGILFGTGLCYMYNAKYDAYQGRSLGSRLLRVAKILPIFALGGYLGGRAAAAAKNYWLKRKLVYMEEYIESHPEDFRTLERKKFKDVLLEWNPIR